MKQASGTDGLRLGRVWTAMIIAQVAIAVTGLPATMMISWSGMQRGLTRANYNEESFLAATDHRRARSAGRHASVRL